MKIGAIEAGGTKFVCGIGNESGVIEDRIVFPTEHPDKTMKHVLDFFRDKGVEGIGVGSFGPIGVNPAAEDYGTITTTPKSDWSGYPFLQTLRDAFNIRLGWDTDVNAAALGEAEWGAAKGLDSCVYYTIGTGVGLGVYAEGRLVHGLVHPEAGHILPRRHVDDDFAGCCPYHGDCLEGLASGPSLEQRWGTKARDLPVEHPAWRIEAYYLGQALIGTILTLSPKKIILGGGVMHQKQLFPFIHAEVVKGLNGYLYAAEITDHIERYIVPPQLGSDAGLFGALALGRRAIENG
ncbi:ROK family protein [Paenibacillus sp. J5C_2022]|uniref:ROK family protein n=1 Tax=Paenibacillus sp. J5C2022 TaxID=2977129 RepID=UPI0021D03790|nr:ROK family protein [Paenibacillus sp. J5C2022]MCU6708064.1 ROK family protein [Paenibacillus sp. J5C2022]